MASELQFPANSKPLRVSAPLLLPDSVCINSNFHLLGLRCWLWLRRYSLVRSATPPNALHVCNTADKISYTHSFLLLCIRPGTGCSSISGLFVLFLSVCMCVLCSPPKYYSWIGPWIGIHPFQTHHSEPRVMVKKKTFVESQLLRLHSEVVWVTWVHILSAACAWMCPGPEVLI